MQRTAVPKDRVIAGLVGALLLGGALVGMAAASTGPFSATASGASFSAIVAPNAFSPSYYGHFSSGLPSSSSFFPIAVWDQSVSGGDVPPPSTNQAEQMKAEGINLNEGQDSNSELPSALAAACAQGIYLIGGNSVTAATVPSLVAEANANSACSRYLAGYDTGDEGCTSTPQTVIPQVKAADPTRMAEWGQSGFFPSDQSAACKVSYNASDLPSADVYEVTNTYLGSICNVPGKQSDCLWGYGVQTHNMVAAVTPGKPVWVDVESGTDDLGASETQGACNATTNLCPQGNEQRATSEQVNSAAWMTLINGANGIIWFCHDSQTSSDACLGGGANGNASACGATCGIPANLTYVDANIQGFAPELNSPDVVGVTGTSSNSATPVVEMTKMVGGVTYLFVEADRAGGATTVTYNVPGGANATAMMVLDSAARYDPSASQQGDAFSLNSSGSFSAGLTGDTGNAAGANSYEVQVFQIGSGGTTTTSTSTSTTTTSTSTTTTTMPATTTTTTTQPPTVSVSGTAWYSTANLRFVPPLVFSGPAGIPNHTYISCSGTYKVGPSGTLTLTCTVP